MTTNGQQRNEGIYMTLVYALQLWFLKTEIQCQILLNKQLLTCQIYLLQCALHLCIAKLFVQYS